MQPHKCVMWVITKLVTKNQQNQSILCEKKTKFIFLIAFPYDLSLNNEIKQTTR